MAFRAYSAQNCKVRVGTAPTTITVRGWTVSPVADHLESTNSEGSGLYDGEFGIIKNNVTIDLHENGSDQLYTIFRPGYRMTFLKLYLNGTNGPFWYFPYFDVTEMPNKADVKDLMGVTITGVGIGATWTYPSGNAI